MVNARNVTAVVPAMRSLRVPKLVPQIGAPQLLSIQVIEVTESGYRGRAKEVGVDHSSGDHSSGEGSTCGELGSERGTGSKLGSSHRIKSETAPGARNTQSARGRVRTCDPKFRKLVLYPTELQRRHFWCKISQTAEGVDGGHLPRPSA